MDAAPTAGTLDTIRSPEPQGAHGRVPDSPRRARSSSPPPTPAAQADDPADADAGLLKEHAVAATADGLLEFFKNRTLDDDRRAKAEKFIKQLGHPRFAMREQAARESRRSARPSSGRSTPPPRIRTPNWPAGPRSWPRPPGPAPARPSSPRPPARLARLKPADAGPVLIAYLPNADDRYAEESVALSLADLGVADGKVRPEIAAAARDPAPLRRGAAGFVLGRSPAANDRAAAPSSSTTPTTRSGSAPPRGCSPAATRKPSPASSTCCRTSRTKNWPG